jgi:hypothetical protein
VFRPAVSVSKGTRIVQAHSGSESRRLAESESEPESACTIRVPLGRPSARVHVYVWTARMDLTLTNLLCI